MFGEVMVRFLRKPIAVFGAVIMIVVVALCLLAPVIAPYDIDAQDITRKFTEPSQEFICGTDNLGRDIFSRLLYGGRISLMVGFVSASIAAILGVILGAIAAFYGKRTDNIIMRILDVFMALPQMLLAIAISAMIGTGIKGAIIAVTVATFRVMRKRYAGQFCQFGTRNLWRRLLQLTPRIPALFCGTFCQTCSAPSLCR